MQVQPILHEQLEILVSEGSLKRGAAAKEGISNLISSGKARLEDAKNADLSDELRFDLAYKAAYSLSLAALQRTGYCSNYNRYVVFQCLEHTLDISKENVRILSSAHRTRNLAEYEGGAEFNEQTIEAIIRAAEEISARLPCPRYGE